MDDPPFEVNLIENLTSEHSEKIKLEAECDTELDPMISNLMRKSILLLSGHRAQVH